MHQYYIFHFQLKMSFTGRKTPTAETFYDKFADRYDELHFKKVKGAKNLTG